MSKTTILLCFLTFLTFGATAQEPSSSTDAVIEVQANNVGTAISTANHDVSSWQFSVVPILWLPPVDGSFSEGGVVLEFEASGSDRINDIHPGGELMLEMTNGKWTFVFQPQYVTVEMGGTLKTPYGNVPAELRSDTIAINFWGARRFQGKNAWVEVLIGGQSFEMKVKTKTILGSSEQTVDWYDPMIGVRGQYQITEQWEAEGMITTSGFNISNTTSEHTLESRLGLNFLTKNNWKFMIGYRTFDVEDKENESSGRSKKVKINLKGPYVGVGYKFK